MPILSTLKENRFLFLLISMFLLLLMQPLLVAAGMHFAQALLKIFVSLVFFSAVYAVSQTRRHLLIGIILMLPSTIMQWAAHFTRNNSVTVTSGLLFLVFLSYVTVAIVRHVLEIDHVTFEQVCGTLCVYMLMGLIWADAYALIDSVFAGQFAVKGMAFADFIYFSFVTLTTLGYGDISPVGAVARSFALAEAIIGQFFLAVLVARQVGLYISQSDR